jgi:hypothetical protein
MFIAALVMIPPQMETKMITNWQIDNENVLYPYSVIVCHNKKVLLNTFYVVDSKSLCQVKEVRCKGHII